MSASTLAVNAQSGRLSPRLRLNLWSFRALLVLADLTALTASFLVGIVWTNGMHFSGSLHGLTLALILLVLLWLAGLYQSGSLNPTEEFKRLIISTTCGFFLLILANGGFHSNLSWKFSLSVWLLTLLFLPFCRASARTLARRLSWFRQPAVLFASGAGGKAIADLLQRKRDFPFDLTAILGDNLAVASIGPSNLVRGEFSLASELSRTARHAIIALSDFPRTTVQEIIEEHARHFAYILLIPDLVGGFSLWVTAKDLGGILALEVSQKLMRREAQLIKRVCDVILSALLLTLLAPFFAALAIAIRLTSSGTVFYGQQRIGRDGRTFTMWKFRSMRSDGTALLHDYFARNPDAREEWTRDHKLRQDPRVTPIGRLLRKTSIDELPQLWNVLSGSMSLVGPRPIVEAEIDKYESVYLDYSRVKPGITGLWQVSGRNNTSYAERVRYDRYYVQNWCVWLDFHILCSTVSAVLFARGAY